MMPYQRMASSVYPGWHTCCGLVASIVCGAFARASRGAAAGDISPRDPRGALRLESGKAGGLMHAIFFADIGSEILQAFGTAVAVLFAFIPALIGALLLLLIGWIVARVARGIVVRVLRAMHFDQLMART